MNTQRTQKVKGFTLVEMIVVLAIVAALAAILIPSFTGMYQRARVMAAIEDCRVIKGTIEGSLIDRFQFNPEPGDQFSDAFNKQIQYTNNGTTIPEWVGCFTSYSWYDYKNNKPFSSKSQQVDKVIAAGLDAKFQNESWKAGNRAANPMKSEFATCADYLSKIDTNFAIIAVYDSGFNIRLIQIYRKGILVSYVDGDYVANTKKTAKFVRDNAWSTIYTDADKTAPEEMKHYKLVNGQDQSVPRDGTLEGWY
jgi:prepilin-type N-terminal cleavage/methylation domain-containing protein